jgi:hypothetical protein
MTTDDEPRGAAMDHHPMVEAYLADLDRALSGSDPREHAETMSAVREHLTDAVPPDATAEQVRQALDELGPVETIAASTTQSTPSPGRPGTDRLAISALIAAVAGMLLLIPVPFIGAPLALIALITGIAHLRTTRQGDPLAWTAVVISALTLAMLMLAIIFLLPVSTTTEPGPVQTVQQSTP